MSGLLRMVSFLVSLVALVAWWIFVAVTSDFNEPGMLVIGALGFVFLSVLAGRQSWSIKIGVLIVMIPVIATVGFGVRKIFIAETRFHDAITRQTLAQVTNAISEYTAKTGSSPDCLYPCMVDRLKEAGIPSRIEWRREDGAAKALDSIPMKDGWRCRYEYRKISDNGFELRSSGPDRRFETDDDIAWGPGMSAAMQTPPAPTPTGPFHIAGLSALNPAFLRLFFRPDW